MQRHNYSYPLNPSWSTAEMETVIAMLRAVEDAYEVGINREELLKRYRAFKQIVNSKAEEKQIGRDFERESGYVLYRVVKQAQGSDARIIKMAGDQ